MTSEERHEARYQRRKAARAAKRRALLAQYDDFDRAASVPAQLHANWEARQGVMFKASVTRYNMHEYRNAVRASRDLYNGKDIRQNFYSFRINERGKIRDIHSLHYAERVIRRSFCTNALVPVLSHSLIYDNGASLKGKGNSFAADRCETHLHRFYRETGSNDGRVVLIDFKGYFNSIRHEPLKAQIEDAFTDKRIVNLSHQFISSRCTASEPQDVGLYIGPEDNQIYAVAYPNRIDHLIKDVWRQKYFGRYMDDSYIICKTKAEAQEILRRLHSEYAKLGIVLNPKKTQIIKLSHGFTFLKTRYILTDTGKVIRKADRSCIVRERRKLHGQYRLFLAGELSLAYIIPSYMSWRGAILKRDAYKSVQHMDARFYRYFSVEPWLNKKKQKGRITNVRFGTGRAA